MKKREDLKKREDIKKTGRHFNAWEAIKIQYGGRTEHLQLI